MSYWSNSYSSAYSALTRASVDSYLYDGSKAVPECQTNGYYNIFGIGFIIIAFCFAFNSQNNVTPTTCCTKGWKAWWCYRRLVCTVKFLHSVVGLGLPLWKNHFNNSVRHDLKLFWCVFVFFSFSLKSHLLGILVRNETLYNLLWGGHLPSTLYRIDITSPYAGIYH